MEENDNIVSQLQRLFSPRPDTRVSDPQTVAEAPRVAAAGLLSEDVATDAHDLTENLVPVTEQGDALDAASAQASAAEHAASDTPVVSADVSASGGANPRLATLGLLKAGVTKIVGIAAPLLSDRHECHEC